MTVGERQKLNVEQQRSVGRDLATRIRFLREEVKAGRDPIGNLEEIRNKASELTRLFPAPDDCRIIAFEVLDTAETPRNASGFMFGRRTVEVTNPGAKPGALRKLSVSLLPVGQVRESLMDLGVSEVLPPAHGGI